MPIPIAQKAELQQLIGDIKDALVLEEPDMTTVKTYVPLLSDKIDAIETTLDNARE